MTDSADRRAARARLEATIYARMYASARGATILGLVSLLVDWLAYPAAAPILSIGSGAMVIVAAGTRVALARAWLGLRGCRLAGLTLWVIAVGQTVLGLVVDGGFGYTLIAILMMVALGLIEVSRPWLAAGLALELAVWLPVGCVLHGADYVVYALALVSAAIVTLVVHAWVMGFLVDLEVLRLRDLTRAAELAAALDRVQRELAERQRVEHEREALREQLLQVRKMEAIGTLAGGVAHDMNNVLATITSLTALLRDDAAPEMRPTIDEVLEIARRGAALTRNLLGFSQRGQYRKATLEVRAVIDGIAQLLEHTLPKRLRVAVAITGDARIEGDASQLRQAVMNLCLNAADAMREDGTIRIAAEATDVDPATAAGLAIPAGRYVAIHVTDTGVGIRDDIKDRIFEPFFTTKPPGTGTGLGLAMVYGTAQAHGGAVSVHSQLGDGTTMTLLLPAVDAAPAAATLIAAGSEVGGAAPAPALGSILVVDDEAALRAATCRRLQRSGYRVASAPDGAAALAAFEAAAGAFDLVLLDMAMPVMGGAECFTQLKRRDPGVKVLIVSGYALEDEARACLAGGALGFVEKPFSPGQLLGAIARAIRGQPADDAAVRARARASSEQPAVA